MQSLVFQLTNLDNTFWLSFWKETPQGFTESSYFLQILKANPDDKEFFRGSTLLWYMDDLLFCSPSQTSSQENCIHLLTFSLKNYNATKGKLLFAQTQV